MVVWLQEFLILGLCRLYVFQILSLPHTLSLYFLYGIFWKIKTQFDQDWIYLFLYRWCFLCLVYEILLFPEIVKLFSSIIFKAFIVLAFTFRYLFHMEVEVWFHYFPSGYPISAPFLEKSVISPLICNVTYGRTSRVHISGGLFLGFPFCSIALFILTLCEHHIFFPISVFLLSFIQDIYFECLIDPLLGIEDKAVNKADIKSLPSQSFCSSGRVRQ